MKFKHTTFNRKYAIPTNKALSPSITENSAINYPAPTVEPSRGELLWIGFTLPIGVARRFALPGGEKPEDLHITLAIPGRLGDFSPTAEDTILEAIKYVARDTGPIKGRISGIGRFNAAPVSDRSDIVYLSFDSDDLCRFHYKLVEHLTEMGVYRSGMHGFIPHISLAYLSSSTSTPSMKIPSVFLTFNEVDFKIRNGSEHKIPLIGPTSEDIRDMFAPRVQRELNYEVVKSSSGINEEKRYTFGVVFMPDTPDAHNDVASAAELERAQWEYVRRNDRKIYIQHKMTAQYGDKVAGEWVSMVTWPTEVNTKFFVPTESPSGLQATMKFEPVKEKTLPANSVYMGVVWEPWAWELVKSGKITGFSFGGLGQRKRID
ncbi:Phage-like element PBSX protein, XkdF [uncultured Caudovirales phage]|uniref:Phage-like element PBSX protein, XkdF n=1 Tax=uncultured Caudovirales phage TaxID=2100421 RepID=A0A6J5RJU8_9CAUD|nr:Phage-like element PBSX protein, XkdF [uncultured Caudovirales phage]CAB4167806.1 Phage-like element PBSX protein, XkdF [uncultured Caudovirales phage]CAB4174143.1 Phage-like element PBSX protein, XkdF [uncultured Caudovirales phage]CAB4180563.1 Phage-like element PBSX protein, XkdF [uncultured Caudovirales phage]CAB4186123.1 Phage-like element PBSX protein, XkdF [uncultured Caudovirales phage]